MRRYFITERWVLNKEILIPSIMIAKNNRIMLVLSCKTLKLGAIDSIVNTVNHTATMAIPDEMSPFIIALILMGRAMNHRVAPTICMVFIKNRLLYIASLIVLSIDTITRIDNIIAITKITIVEVLTNLVTLETTLVGV